MFGNNSFGLGMFQRNQFDSAAGNAAAHLAERLTPIDERQLLANIQTTRAIALSVVLQLADAIAENSLGEEVLPSEYLDTLMLAGVDTNENDEIDTMVNQLLSANIADALSTLGVPDDMISDIMGDNVEAADGAIEAMSPIVISNLPDAGDALTAFEDVFIYGFDADEALLDDEDEQYDAVHKPKQKARVGGSTVREVNGKKIRYKGVKVVRNGKVTVVNKRLAGQTLIKTSAQKSALKKLHNKAHSYSAINKRLRSLGKGIKANIYKGKRAGHAAAAVKAANTGLAKHFGDS